MQSASNPQFKDSLLKLAPNGSNWIMYKSRMLTAIGARGLTRFLNGGVVVPTIPTPPGASALKEDVEKYEVALTKFDEHTMKEQEGRNMILTTIPDSVHLRVLGEMTMQGVWKKVTEEFEGKTDAFQMELRRRLQNTTCPSDGDVHQPPDHRSDLTDTKGSAAGRFTRLPQ